MTQSLIIRMAIGHAHFEAVHPFRDGNGRLGRLLFPLAMAAEHHLPLYLSPYIEANKSVYYQALRQAQQRLSWVAIISFMSDAIVATVSHLEGTVAALSELKQQWLQRRAFRRNSAALRCLDILVQYPVITIQRLAKELGVGYPNASAAVAQLVNVGILEERTGFKRNRVFAAPELLAVVNRPFEERDI